MWSGTGVFCSPVAVVAPPANRRDLTHAGIQAERGKPVCFPKGRQPQGEPMSVRAEEDGKSEGHFVMKWIGIEPTATLSHAQAGRLPFGLSSQENLRNR